MNGSQLTAVLAGIALCLAGVIVGVSPVDAPLVAEGPAAVIPLLDPLTAFDRRPSRVVLTVGLPVAGVVTAAAGAYRSRDRR